MTEILNGLSEGLRALSGWEALAVAAAIAYLLLAIRQNVLCWPAAILSAGIYLLLMYGARLYMQSALQAFYIAMALYGWHQWLKGGPGGGKLRVTSWSARQHVAPLALILLLAAVNGWLLSAYSEAAFPWLDSLAAWGAIVTTWMVARKVLQNWHYWFVIDALSMYLYAARGLWLTATLFGLYLVLIMIGYRQWRTRMEAQRG